MKTTTAPATTTPTTRPGTAAPVTSGASQSAEIREIRNAPTTNKTALLTALRSSGIEASPRTLATWMETADKLCMALATY